MYLFLERWQNPILHPSFCNSLQTAPIITGVRKENNDHDNDNEYYVPDLSDDLHNLLENNNNEVSLVELDIADSDDPVIKNIRVLHCKFENSTIYIASHRNFKGYLLFRKKNDPAEIIPVLLAAVVQPVQYYRLPKLLKALKFLKDHLGKLLSSLLIFLKVGRYLYK